MSNLIGLTFSTTMLLNWVLFYQDASRKDGFWAHRWFWTSPHRRYIGKAPWSRPGQTWAWSCPPPSTRSSSPPANTWSPATGHRVRHNQGVSQCLMWCQGDCKRVVWYIILKIPAGLLYCNMSSQRGNLHIQILNLGLTNKSWIEFLYVTKNCIYTQYIYCPLCLAYEMCFVLRGWSVDIKYAADLISFWAEEWLIGPRDVFV